MSSTITLDHQWDPIQVLRITRYGRCVGKASTTRDGTCCNPINKANMRFVNAAIAELSSQRLDATVLRPKLELLASRALCLRWHHNQVNEVVRAWVALIDNLVASSSPLDVRARRNTDTRRAVASSAPLEATSTPVARNFRRSSSTGSAAILPLTLQTEAESLHRNITAMREVIRSAERSNERMQIPQTPRLEPGRYVARVLTADLSSLQLSVTSSAVSSASSAGSGSPTTSSRSSSPARSTSSRSSAISTSSSNSSAPPSPYAQSGRRPQSTPARPMATSMRYSATTSVTNESGSGAPLRQGLAAAWQEFIDSQAQAPPAPLDPVSPCTRTHVRRIPLSDECPICYSGEPLSSLPASDLIWCTSSCGRTVHKSCFDDWADQCRITNRSPDCPVCRADWRESCACGGLSTCRAVHATRKDLEATPCPICREVMQEGDGVEWCKEGCGQSVHRECMGLWKTHCVLERKAPHCTMCRAEWKDECAC